jgi:hypothetical protein
MPLTGHHAPAPRAAVKVKPDLQTLGVLRNLDPAGRATMMAIEDAAAKRSAGAISDQVPVSGQFEDSQGARPHDPRNDVGHRG